MKTKKKKDNKEVSHYDTWEKRDWEKQRNKTLSNLMILFEELQIVQDCKIEERAAFRKELLEDISKTLGCSKRTAYDYMLAIESILSVSRFCTAAKNVIIGGKKNA